MATAPAAGAPRLGSGHAAFALALLLGLQPVTTDVYLPALPLLTRELAAPMPLVQLTMSALILAFGLSQLLCGPLADRVGRRPVLLGGLALYLVASIGATLAPGIAWLVAWRVLQGAALAAAIVCARAIVRDLYEPVQGAQVMTRAMGGLGVIALASPLLGGLVAATAGWRGALALVAAVGAAALLYVAWRLPETLHERDPRALQPGPLLRNWWAVLRERQFRAWALLVACTYGGLFTVLASSSFVYMDLLGLSPGAYGATMAVGSASYIAGTLACQRWIPRLGLAGTVRRGAWFTLAGGALVVGVWAAGLHQVWAVLAAQCLFLFGHGQHQPVGQAGVVAPFPRAAGAASALAGFVLAAVAFAIGRWLGVAMDGSLRPLALGLGFWALLTALTAWTLVQRAAR
ncbi:MAG: Bcr/CflA family efflux MFS transporter [Rubrivivax sp.]|nr:Bcr/CflA family efflux MFS transporter [Rubrivivax sp.]